ncbi:peptide chain release factor N(5)-glutamine methyltransferase [Dethiothermospora halolimnae]|uniref:peptide chain release factor N(5)-glutamine methyltransferase n=1 Tax=Dethiothermospora halolimnae TaxID=3114390 RepID=UPI003CCBDBC7
MKTTIQNLLKTANAKLKERRNPQLDSMLLLCYVINVDKIYIYTHRDQVIDMETVDKFYKLVEKRSKGYPLQYIIKKQEFMGLDFFVDEGVLVPRPDTEILVESIIKLVNESNMRDKDNINIVDIGTGSGAITLSLAHYIKNAFIYSIDISQDALNIAKRNCKNLRLENRVEFLNGDLFKPLENLYKEKEIDIIVSNPPYIPTKDITNLEVEVSQYEPKLALDGGIDGLNYYKKIIEQAPNYLKANGILALEIGYNQGKDLKKLLQQIGKFDNIEIKKDLAGHDRVVIAMLK